MIQSQWKIWADCWKTLNFLCTVCIKDNAVKFHLGEFRKWLKFAQHGQVTDKAIEKYLEEAEKRKERARQKKIVQKAIVNRNPPLFSILILFSFRDKIKNLLSSPVV